MDFYNFERAGIVKNYANIEKIERNLQILSKRFHAYNTNAINYEIICIDKINKYKEKIKEIRNEIHLLSVDLKNIISKLIICNMKIYANRNQSINIISIDNPKLFKIKFNLSIDTKINKFINSKSLKKIYNIINSEKSNYINIDKLDSINIYLKAELNKAIPKFYKKREQHSNTKLKSIVKKEQSNIKKFEIKINKQTKKIDKLTKSLIKNEHEIFITKEYMKLEYKKNTKRTKQLSVEIMSLAKKCKYIVEQYNNEIETINAEYKYIFDKNKITEICPICLEEDKRYIKTSCGHSFHIECICSYIDDLLLRNNIEISCPMCRQTMC